MRKYLIGLIALGGKSTSLRAFRCFALFAALVLLLSLGTTEALANNVTGSWEGSWTSSGSSSSPSGGLFVSLTQKPESELEPFEDSITGDVTVTNTDCGFPVSSSVIGRISSGFVEFSTSFFAFLPCVGGYSDLVGDFCRGIRSMAFTFLALYPYSMTDLLSSHVRSTSSPLRLDRAERSRLRAR